MKRPQKRAPIYDRTGTLLAFNRTTPSAFVLPLTCNKRPESMSFLKEHYPHTYEQVKQHPKRKFMWLSRRITPEQAEQITEQKLPGIDLVFETQRFYPHLSCAHLVGFTDVDNHGIAGIELSLEKQLAGSPTTHMLQKDARSRSFYFQRTLADKGNLEMPVALTIDHTLQFFAYEELKKTVAKHHAQRGAVLIMEPTTGDILAMTTYPGFDPHKPGSAPRGATKSVALNESFELGSVFKVFSTLAALEEGVTTLDEKIDCEGKKTYFGKFKVENWKPLGVLPFLEVARQSSNVGMAKIARRLGEKLHDHLYRLGFGQKIGLSFPGERSGYLNPPHNWSKYSPLTLSFGYEVMANLVQLGRAFSVISNGGLAVTPRLILDDENRTQTNKRLYKAETVETIKTIFENPRTIFPQIKKRHPLPGYRVIGKTGTARKLVDGKYSRTQHVDSFAGMIEKGDYKRVVITFVEEPKHVDWASQVSAPLFQRVAERMVVHDTLSA